MIQKLYITKPTSLLVPLVNISSSLHYGAPAGFAAASELLPSMDLSPPTDSTLLDRAAPSWGATQAG